MVLDEQQIDKVEQLLKGAISNDLPNLFGFQNIIDFDKIIELYYKVKTGELIKGIQFEGEMIKAKFTKGMTPDYIHGDGTEPNIYFTYKKTRTYERWQFQI